MLEIPGDIDPMSGEILYYNQEKPYMKKLGSDRGVDNEEKFSMVEFGK